MLQPFMQQLREAIGMNGTVILPGRAGTKEEIL